MMPTLDQETILISRAIQSDESAWNELHRIFMPVMKGYIRVRIHSDLDQEAILQDAFIRIWKSLPKYNPDRAPLVAFVIKHAIWALADSRRSLIHKEALFSELIDRYPTLKNDEEIVDFLGKQEFSKRGSEDTVPTEVYDELWKLTFNISHPPHQLIVFGYCKLLALEPRAIVSEYSDSTLKTLGSNLEDKCLAGSMLSGENIRSCFHKLRENLDLPLYAVLEERKTREIYKRMLNRLTGGTRLTDYFTESPAANIAHWWSAVERRVQSRLRKQGSLPKSLQAWQQIKVARYQQPQRNKH
jgi:DNA-directed RNA polymerase specialized sigma24 family protein